MKIAVVGGGPAGLYFALLIKQSRPEFDLTVLERNRRDDTFGWGVVFSDQTLENFRAADAITFEKITSSLAHWDDIDVYVRGRVIRSGGHGFSGIARKKLINILQDRCEQLGVTLRFQAEVRDDAGLARYGLAGVPTTRTLRRGVETGADLIVAADGVNSAMRARHAAHFGPDLDVRKAKYIWLGTTFPFEAFTFYFVENAHGVFQAHCYRFDAATSTFIVECDDASWRSAGFDRLDLPGTVAACEALFAPWLNGHRLQSNALATAAPWTSFVRVRNRSWFHDNIVLIGDAAHTAHFSIGSGTKLAMEDAIALARVLAGPLPAASALAEYQRERMTEALRLQNAARNSMEWFENVKRYIRLEPEQFTYSLLTRSQRVSHENLRLRDRGYLNGVERWFAAGENSRRPMFTPYSLRGMTLSNRVVVAPMDMYSADDGMPGEFHLVHLGARALGGAGLIITEMTCVSPDARITLGCTGMYRAEHVAAWRRIVDFVHRHSAAKMCLQLGHAGAKGSTQLPWEGGPELPLDADQWDVVAPSAIRFAPTLPIPRAMTRADMDRVRENFVNATRMGLDAGFDMIELHCAHGYLLSSFITPLTNQRSDEYGGSIENRVRYPLEVFSAMREAWPANRPMSVRISATDWVEDGLTGDDAVIVARAFADAGVDIVHVSTGQTSINARPVYGRMYQTPFSDQVRNELGIPTIAVGNITDPDQVNSIIAAGRADLCALARPHLSDPFWTLHAAAQFGYAEQPWPVQYLTGKQQLERELSRKAVTS